MYFNLTTFEELANFKSKEVLSVLFTEMENRIKSSGQSFIIEKHNANSEPDIVKIIRTTDELEDFSRQWLS